MYTPIRNYIPGYPTESQKKMQISNSVRLDSLIEELEDRDLYLKMLRDAMFNEVPIDEDFAPLAHNITGEQITMFNDITNKQKTEPKSQSIREEEHGFPALFPPIKGIIKSSFNKKEQHYGTDIASLGETFIFACLDGNVLFVDYVIETGYTIILLHESNLVSVYRHNDKPLVKVNQRVKAGEKIAIYGGTGEYSSGEHLHFELWQKGELLDPEKYIDFE